MELKPNQKNQSRTKYSVETNLQLRFLSPIEHFLSEWLLNSNGGSEQHRMVISHCNHYHIEVNQNQKINQKEKRQAKRYVYNWILNGKAYIVSQKRVRMLRTTVAVFRKVRIAHRRGRTVDILEKTFASFL